MSSFYSEKTIYELAECLKKIYTPCESKDPMQQCLKLLPMIEGTKRLTEIVQRIILESEIQSAYQAANEGRC